jgi:hypothetical protein
VHEEKEEEEVHENLDIADCPPIPINYVSSLNIAPYSSIIIPCPSSDVYSFPKSIPLHLIGPAPPPSSGPSLYYNIRPNEPQYN